MKLADAADQEVVRNISNDSYYRYERPAGTKIRIRPLELFPNGLLIAKPTDTIVEPDIDVELLGGWEDHLVIAGGRGKSRPTYEKERERLIAQLEVLEAEALMIAPKQRGSHANRVKAVRNRLIALDRGLEDLGTEEQPTTTVAQIPPSEFRCKQMVIMPSGTPAQFLGLLPVNQHLLATVYCKLGKVATILQIDPAALRPYERRHLATV